MAKAQPKSTLSNTLLVTVSGSYVTANKVIESFDQVQGLVPRMDDDKVAQMVIRRYALIWVAQARKRATDGTLLDEPKYKHIQRIRQVFIDSVEDNEDNPHGVLSYVGKNVMEMNAAELQDFASANDLAGIPLFRATSLVQTRRVAFSEYATKVLELFEPDDPKAKKPQNLYDWRVKGFNPNRFEPLIADGEIRRMAEPDDVEEGLAHENERMQRKKPDPEAETPTDTRMTLAMLKKVADGRNITYHKAIGFQELYKKLYGTLAA